jgi:hypothetical protein
LRHEARLSEGESEVYPVSKDGECAYEVSRMGVQKARFDWRFVARSVQTCL